MFPFHQYNMGVYSDRALFNPTNGAFIESPITIPKLDVRVSSLERELSKIRQSQEELQRSQADLMEARKNASARMDERFDQLLQLLETRSKLSTPSDSGVASLDDRLDRLFLRLEASGKLTKQLSSSEADAREISKEGEIPGIQPTHLRSKFAGEEALQIHEGMNSSCLESVAKEEKLECVNATELGADAALQTHEDSKEMQEETIVLIVDRNQDKREEMLNCGRAAMWNEIGHTKKISEELERTMKKVAREKPTGKTLGILGLISQQNKFEPVFVCETVDDELGSKSNPDPDFLGPPPWSIYLLEHNRKKQGSRIELCLEWSDQLDGLRVNGPILQPVKYGPRTEEWEVTRTIQLHPQERILSLPSFLPPARPPPQPPDFPGRNSRLEFNFAAASPSAQWCAIYLRISGKEDAASDDPGDLFPCSLALSFDLEYNLAVNVVLSGWEGACISTRGIASHHLPEAAERVTSGPEKNSAETGNALKLLLPIRPPPQPPDRSQKPAGNEPRLGITPRGMEEVDFELHLPHDPSSQQLNWNITCLIKDGNMGLLAQENQILNYSLGLREFGNQRELMVPRLSSWALMIYVNGERPICLAYAQVSGFLMWVKEQAVNSRAAGQIWTNFGPFAQRRKEIQRVGETRYLKGSQEKKKFRGLPSDACAVKEDEATWTP